MVKKAIYTEESSFCCFEEVVGNFSCRLSYFE